MVLLKELRALAKDYWLPNRSKLKKKKLIEAIAKVKAQEFLKRVR
ncbi:MAG: Rho termination factor N-terminal domain-containing protein [Candidatus Thiodiazotropha sp.]